MIAVLDLRQRGDEVAIPGAVVGAHALLDEGVRRVEREMRRGRTARPGPVQSCGATGRCQASAIAAILRASERPPHQERSSMIDAGGAGLQKIAERPAGRQRLGGADRRGRSVGVALEAREAVHLDRVLVPERVERRERPGDRDGGQQLPQRMELDHDVHPVADRLADLLERLQARTSGRRGEMSTPRLASAAEIERPDLHRRDALGEKLERRARRPGAGSR